MKQGPGLLVKHFDDDHYTAAFDQRTGCFVRMEDDGHAEPLWSRHGPELLDVSITSWCDRCCACCYRRSGPHGVHIDVDSYKEILRQAAELHVFQIALGGGNPNQHPMFPEILRTTRADYGIVPNYTTNGRGLDDCVLRATAKYCGAVAVSAYAPYEETEAAVEKLARNDIAATVHFVLSSRSIDTAITWLKDPPRFLRTARAIVFLNYKPVGRVVDETSLLGRSPRLDEFFDLATADDSLVRVGFDTCTISGVAGLGRVHRSSLEACDAGRFSLFVSERMEVFPCSFMLEAGYRGVSLRDKPMAEIWRDHPSFEKMRNRQPETRCRDCWAFSECLSGCPLFPEVNLCGATGLRGRPSGEIL